MLDKKPYQRSLSGKMGKKNVLINSAILPNDKNVQNSFLFYKEKVTLDRGQKDFNNKIKLFNKNELKKLVFNLTKIFFLKCLTTVAN